VDAFAEVAAVTGARIKELTRLCGTAGLDAPLLKAGNELQKRIAYW
jgi:hypothetical protein